MYISDFTYYRPETTREAAALLEKNKDSAVIAGGTDLMVDLKQGLKKYSALVSLTGIEELKIISEDENNIYIGPVVTHNGIIASGIIKRCFPALALACSKIGSEQIRNTGTIGGNICTASSCCDTAPVLLAAGAKAEIQGTAGNKIINLSDFFVFNRKTILQNNEILCRLIIPKPCEFTGMHYEKFGLRDAMSISVVSVAVKLVVKDDTIYNSCVVIGAAAPTPKISEKAAALLNGTNIKDLNVNSDILNEIAAAASGDSLPIDDIRGSVNYRREVLKTITRRAVLKAVESIKK